MNSRLKPIISGNLDDPRAFHSSALAIPSVDSVGWSEPIVAHSFDFVAKPSKTQRLEVKIPAALTAVLRDVTGFAGCLVMVAMLEARLVTVVTLWEGADSHRRCVQNASRIQTILAQYVDHPLRMQTHRVSGSSILTLQPVTNASDRCGIEAPSCTRQEGLSVA